VGRHPLQVEDRVGPAALPLSHREKMTERRDHDELDIIPLGNKVWRTSFPVALWPTSIVEGLCYPLRRSRLLADYQGTPGQLEFIHGAVANIALGLEVSVGFCVWCHFRDVCATLTLVVEMRASEVES